MAWYHRAKVGDKVVCIVNNWSDDPRAVRFGLSCPQGGSIYTIRRVVPTDAGIGIFLVEIINPPHIFVEGLAEPAFSVKAFRPVQSSSTEKHVVELKKLLNLLPVEETEPV